MKQSILILSVIFSMFFLAGCDNLESITSPESSLEKANIESLSLEKVTESINGSGHFINEDGVLRVFTLNAKRSDDEDGSVSGHFNLNSKQSGVHFSGSIICFTKEGNQVWFLGIIEQSNSAYPENSAGAYCTFWVEDNGQGKNAEPDRITRIGSTDIQILIDRALEACGGDYISPEDFGEFLGFQNLIYSWNEVESGNITVR